MRFLLAALLAIATAPPLAAASYSNFQFSHDGKRIIAVGPRPGDLSTWDVKQPGKRRTISFPGRTIHVVLVSDSADKVAIHSEKDREDYLDLIDLQSMKVEHELSKGKKDKGLRYRDPTYLAGDGSRVYFAIGAKDKVVYVDFNGGKEKSFPVSPSPDVNDVVDKSHVLGGIGGT